MGFGLQGYIADMERPYADQNAQADIEGRARPPTPYSGVSLNPQSWWVNRYIEPTPIERYMERGASLSEAVHLAAKDKRNG